MSPSDELPDPSDAPDWARDRLRELDGRNRSLRRQVRLLGAGLLACMAGVAFVATVDMSSPRFPDTIETKAVILRDDTGAARAELSIGSDGSAQLALRDQEEVDRVRLTVRGEGSPGLAFADQDGNRRIVLGLLPDETSTMVFADQGGVIRAILGLSEDDRSNLVFADKSGTTRIGLGVDARGIATVMLPEGTLGDSIEGAGSAPGGDS